MLAEFLCSVSVIAVGLLGVTTVNEMLWQLQNNRPGARNLDPQKRSSTSRHFEEELWRRIVGQNEAEQALVDLYQIFSAGWRWR